MGKLIMHATKLIALLISFNKFICIVYGQEDVTIKNENVITSNSDNYYWPPAYNSDTIELEKILMQHLDLDCPVFINQSTNITFGNVSDFNTNITYTTNSSSASEYFMISETENREKLNNPHPLKFVHIPSGTILQTNFECDDCPNDKISYNGKFYDTSKFECKTLCIFTAKKTYTDSCRKGQMYKIGLKFKNKFYKLLEACHHLEVPSNKTYDAEKLIWKLGKYSRTIQNEKSICQSKCMPICSEFNEMESKMNNKSEVIQNYAMKFIENLCMKNIENTVKNIEEITCVEQKNGAHILGGSFLMYLILGVKIGLNLIFIE